MENEEQTRTAAGEDVDRLTAALTGFETALVTPLVSGELLDWSGAVGKAWEELQAAWREHPQRHESQYTEMSEVDQEIFRHVERLRNEDNAITAEIVAVDAEISRLDRKTPAAERDHLRAEESRQKVVDQGIALVVRIRKQEIALKTWFVEAFNRDRGSVD